MGCCGQNTTGAAPVSVDTGKRVNYTLGMLLGVDDFVQEQAWQSARRHELAREVLGYGTVRGLQVLLEPLTSPPSATRIRVTPGMAWTPSGTAVCVPSEQCCDVDAWLARHTAELTPLVSGSPAAVTLYVVLSYAACLTDNVPIPGEPCRSEDELMQPSRVADGFLLELRTAPPPQVEEDAIRDFADWLAAVPVDTGSPPLSESEFLVDLRSAALAWLQPTSPSAPLPGDYMFGSPPAGLASTDALLRAALRLWVTELRPLWRARYGCGAQPGSEAASADAVLLAELQVPLLPRAGGGWTTVGPVEADESRRPLLLSLRMVQELITQNAAPEPADSVLPALDFGLPASPGSDSAYARTDHSHGTPALPVLAGEVTGPVSATRLTQLLGRGFAATAPRAGDVLVINTQGNWGPRHLPAAGGAPAAGQQFGLPVATGTSTDFARADHSHGTPELAGDATVVVEGGAQRVRVEGLRRFAIDTVAPAPGQVLTFGTLSGGGSGWLPAAPIAGVSPATTVVAQQQFGTGPVVGSSAAYARADHNHGTPALGGDVQALAGSTTPTVRVVALQGVGVRAVRPVTDQVLAFDGTAWTPATLPAPTAGSFVDRGAGPYALVAAGHARVLVTRTTSASTTAMLSRYGGLTGAAPQTVGQEVRVRFRANVRDAENARASYLVKLTPVWTENSKIEFSVYLLQAVRAEGRELIEFTVRLRLAENPPEGTVLEFQIEVSRFEA